MIDVARVATFGRGVPHRARGIDRVVVPAADFEIDIDMENALDGSVYLWGAFDGTTYRPAVSWDPASPEVEARVFAEFWEWVSSARRDAAASGKTIAFYCWSQSAEAGGSATVPDEPPSCSGAPATPTTSRSSSPPASSSIS